jgi:hypothetical protein
MPVTPPIEELLTIEPLAGLLHVRRDRAHHLVGAGDVDLVDREEVLGRQPVEVLVGVELGLGGVVDQVVDAAPLLDRRRGHALADRVVADVALEHDGLGARFSQAASPSPRPRPCCACS